MKKSQNQRIPKNKHNLNINSKNLNIKKSQSLECIWNNQFINFCDFFFQSFIYFPELIIQEIKYIYIYFFAIIFIQGGR